MGTSQEVGLAILKAQDGMYGMFSRKITNYMVMYGVYIQLWPTS